MVVMEKPITSTPRPGSVPSSPSERERVVGQIEEFIKEILLGLAPSAPPARSGPGRPLVLPSLALWAGLLLCVLKGFSSKLDLWRLLSSRGLWFYPRFPVSDQAVYKRLEGAGLAPMEGLFYRVSSVLKERLGPYADGSLAPFAREAVVLDESAIDPLSRRLPALRALPKGDRKLLPGKFAGLFDLRRQLWLKVLFVPDLDHNEKLSARTMISDLPAGSLILADLGYFAFEWFDDLTALGHHWISRLRAKTSYELLHVYYQSGETLDAVVYLGAYRANRASHPVRLVRFRVGSITYQYIASVLDPKVLPMVEIARLYARRWDIELAINLAKTHLGLHLLWSTKPVGVMQQLYAVLIISQILQAIRMEVAGRASVDPFEVSIELLVRWMPQFAYAGEDPVAAFVEQGRTLGFIRPSTRTRIRAPIIPEEEIAPLPPRIALPRTPRYAHTNCGPRATRKRKCLN